MEWRLLGTGVELRLSSELLLGDNPLHERQLRAAHLSQHRVVKPTAASEPISTSVERQARHQPDFGLRRHD